MSPKNSTTFSFQPQTNIPLVWFCESSLGSVIHAEQSHHEPSHPGTPVCSPPAWKISIISDRSISPPGPLSPTSPLSTSLQGSQSPVNPITTTIQPFWAHRRALSLYLDLCDSDSYSSATYVFARAWPVTGCCLFSLKQTVWLFNLRPGCAFLRCSRCSLRDSFLSFLKAHVSAAQGTASSHPPTVGTQALFFFFSRPACHPTVRNPSSLLAVDLFTHGLSQLHRNNSTTPKAWLLRYDLTM